MRHMLIVLGMCLAAILVGVGLYLFGPAELRETPVLDGAGASALGADQAASVPFTVLAEGTDASGASERKNFAVYSQEDYARLWAMAGRDAAAMPAVDFESQYVIGVFAGEQPTGGYAIRVTGITDASSLRTVAIALTRPSEGCAVSEALTRPYQLVMVPASDRDLARTETETAACQ